MVLSVVWRCAGAPPSQPGVEGAVEAGAPPPDLSPLEPLPPSVNVEELQRRISESFSRKLAEWERRKYRRPTTPEMEHRGWRIRKEKEERTRSKKSREEKERERQEKAREREMQKVEKEQVRREKDREKEMQKVEKEQVSFPTSLSCVAPGQEHRTTRAGVQTEHRLTMVIGTSGPRLAERYLWGTVCRSSLN